MITFEQTLAAIEALKGPDRGCRNFRKVDTLVEGCFTYKWEENDGTTRYLISTLGDLAMSDRWQYDEESKEWCHWDKRVPMDATGILITDDSLDKIWEELNA